METDPAKINDPPPRYEPPAPAPYPSFAPGQAQGNLPSQGYPPSQGMNAQYAQTTVVIQQPQSMAISGSTYRYSQYPALIICQHCQATVTTTMNYETGLLTWAVAGAICLFGLWLGCCLIPFCITATKDVVHSCPNCKNVVGKFRHFS